MNPVIGMLAVAGVMLLAAVLCMMVYVRSRKPRGEAPPVAPASPALKTASEPQERPAAAAPAAPEPEAPTHRFQVVSGSDIQQCLFVVLDWPGLDTNRRLTKLLRQYQAHYDARLGVFVIRDARAGYKLTVAGSTPPGHLPPLFEGDDQPVVKGVSILIHFINKRSVARQPDTLIDLTQAIAAIGGKILDADRNEVGQDEFERLRRRAG